MASAEYGFPPIGETPDDDLPRTFRREKEARAREARERAAQERAAAPSLSMPADDRYASPQPQSSAAADHQPMLVDMPYPASVRRFDVPFAHLVVFFLKAAVAAIPALILLSIIMWAMGAVASTIFPDMMKLKILIGVGT